MKSLIDLTVSLLIALTMGAEQSKQDPVRTLALGETVERELRGGETDQYKIKLNAGQFLHAVIEQRGIDVVALIGPEAKKLVEVDWAPFILIGNWK